MKGKREPDRCPGTAAQSLRAPRGGEAQVLRTRHTLPWPVHTPPWPVHTPTLPVHTPPRPRHTPLWSQLAIL